MLHAPVGVRCVAVLKSPTEQYELSYGDRNTLGNIGGCYGLYRRRQTGDTTSAKEIPLAFLYTDESWRTLEEMADMRGIIYAKRPAWSVGTDGCSTGEQADPRFVDAKLAHVDFQQVVPQFVCGAREAHAFMDALAAAFFVVMTVETRRERWRKEMGSLPAYEPRRDERGQYMK
jgi:hypothetical protein